MFPITVIIILVNFVMVLGSVTLQNANKSQRITRRKEVASAWEYQSEFKNVSLYAFQGDKSKMMDNFFINENIKDTEVSLFAIFHNHGTSDFPAKYAIDELMTSLENKINIIKKTKKRKDIPEDLRKYRAKHKIIDYETFLKDEIMSFEKELLQQLRKQGNISGTTALVMILDKKKIYIANVGDSRAVMGVRKGKAKRLTKDHKPKARHEEIRINEDGGKVEYDELNKNYQVDGFTTSRMLGSFLSKTYGSLSADPDIFTYDLLALKSKFVILASSGLWNDIGDIKAVALIEESIDSGSFDAKILIDKAYESGSPDNMTVIVVNIDEINKKTDQSLLHYFVPKVKEKSDDSQAVRIKHEKSDNKRNF